MRFCHKVVIRHSTGATLEMVFLPICGTDQLIYMESNQLLLTSENGIESHLDKLNNKLQVEDHRTVDGVRSNN